MKMNQSDQVKETIGVELCHQYKTIVKNSSFLPPASILFNDTNSFQTKKQEESATLF